MKDYFDVVINHHEHGAFLGKSIRDDVEFLKTYNGFYSFDGCVRAVKDGFNLYVSFMPSFNFLPN